MPRLYSPNSIECKISAHDTTGHLMFNTMHFAGSNPVTEEDCANAAAAVVFLYTDGTISLSDFWSNRVIVDTVTAQATDREFGPYVTSVINVTGTDTSAPLPPELTPLMLFETGLEGRRHHGRGYLFPTGDDDIAAGNRLWTEGFVTDYTAKYNDWLTSYAFTTAVPAVISYKWQETQFITNYHLAPVPAIRKGRQTAR